LKLLTGADTKNREFEQSMSRGKTALRQKDWAGAERAFKAALRLAPGKTEANRRLADAKAKRVR
jgi:cytochrome c-type biogenesis protein CcmH/NrfG